jgi:DNA-binding transcriptional MocR family regulator
VRYQDPAAKSHLRESGPQLATRLVKVALFAENRLVISTRVTAQQLARQLGEQSFSHPRYGDLAARIRMLLIDGRLAAGTRLPSERTLAEVLGLSRTTVAAAYARLRDAGFVEPRRGSGHVTSGVPALPTTMVASPVPDGVVGWVFAACPAPGEVASAFARAGERIGSLLAGPGYLPEGLPELRARIADRYAARGLPTRPDQIVVTSGAVAALNVVLRAVLGAGDRVLCESPTYPGAVDAVQRAGGRLVGFPLTDDGWDPARLELVLRQSAPRLAYLIPDYQNPTGRLMTGAQRSATAQLLRRYGVVPVIDETTSELRLDGPTEPPFATHGSEAITIGSASKAYWGGLRIGWIRAPRDLVRPLIEQRAILDLASPVFEQLVLAEVLDDPAPLLAGQRLRLIDQRDRLLADLTDRFPDWRVAAPPGGLVLWAELPTESSTRLAMAAERHGLLITPGPRFFVGGGGERYVRLPYTQTPAVATEAVDRLAAAWAAEVRDPRPTSPWLSLTA